MVESECHLALQKLCVIFKKKKILGGWVKMARWCQMTVMQGWHFCNGFSE